MSATFIPSGIHYRATRLDQARIIAATFGVTLDGITARIEEKASRTRGTIFAVVSTQGRRVVFNPGTIAQVVIEQGGRFLSPDKLAEAREFKHRDNLLAA